MGFRYRQHDAELSLPEAKQSQQLKDVEEFLSGIHGEFSRISISGSNRESVHMHTAYAFSAMRRAMFQRVWNTHLRRSSLQKIGLLGANVLCFEAV